MRLPLICPVCMNEDLSRANIESFAEFNDTGLYSIDCKKGHKAKVVLQQQNFELLFEIGAFAIKDGYYREAVSSFTSCLERTYEFFIKAVLLNKGISPKKLDNAWKKISKQSERQLGAFILVFLENQKNVPEILETADIEFRNKVIHQGHIPTREKAIEYGDRILRIVRSLLTIARAEYQKGIDQVVVGQMITNQAKATLEGAKTSSMSFLTIVSLSTSDPEHQSRSLSEALMGLKRFDEAR